MTAPALTPNMPPWLLGGQQAVAALGESLLPPPSPLGLPPSRLVSIALEPGGLVPGSRLPFSPHHHASGPSVGGDEFSDKPPLLSLPLPATAVPAPGVSGVIQLLSS